MKKITLTCAHAIVKYLIAQKILIDGKKEPLFPGVFGIFGLEVQLWVDMQEGSKIQF